MMKAAILVLAIVGATMSRAEEPYSPGVRHVLGQLRQEKNEKGVPLLRGRSESYGGKNGAFYLLGPYVFSYATNTDVIQMLSDESPVVRILAAKRILRQMTPMFRPEAVEMLLKDKTLVAIGPLDSEKDTYRTMTVADVVQELRKNPHFPPLDFFPEDPSQLAQPGGTPQSRN